MRRWQPSAPYGIVVTAAAVFLLLVRTSTGDDSVATQSHRALFGSQNYICALTANIFRFEFDEFTGLYVFKQENQNSSNFLAIPEGADEWVWNTSENDRKLRLLQADAADSTNTTEPPGPFLDVRVCWCTEFALRDYEFCPIEFNTCLVPNPHRISNNGTNTVGCFISHPADTLVRSFWPALVFWCAATLYAIICSEPGLYARQYLVRRLVLCGSRNTTDAEVERMLTEQPQRAAGLFRQHLVNRYRRRQRQQQWAAWRRRAMLGTSRSGNNSNGNGAMDEGRDALVLRTKVFRPEEATESRDAEAGQDEEEESTRPQCAICLLELEDGERIGDIPCGHLLHKECLKDWLVRKNKCPLCQQSGVARLVVHGDTSNNTTSQPHRNRIVAAAAAANATANNATTVTPESSEAETSI